MTGRILADGVTVGEIRWSEGTSIVNDIDSTQNGRLNDDQFIKGHAFSIPRHQAIGCNMAFRTKAVQHLRFDERLVLYGWLEDRDFRFEHGRDNVILTDFVWGVTSAHDGAHSGLRFGYAQVVNPWYLMRKGTMGSF